VGKGDIVVAGRNFGIGSSRPVGSLFMELGVSALIAEEFNSLFLRNCINVGLPALTVPSARSFFSEGDVAEIDVATGEYANRATGRTGRTKPLPGLVLEILRAGGVLPQLAAAGYLPEEAAAALRSGAINAAAASGSSA
jgi:3-isopropylmalate/(R)-2-methylmalate dehydratase small subunit